MDKYECLKKLMSSFPESFLSYDGHFVAEGRANSCFIFDNCETELDVKCKLLEWLSRDSYKSEPFYRQYENQKFHEFILNGINKFLGTNFTESDMEIIYQHLGNCCNHQKTIKFIESGYDFSVLHWKE